MQPDDRRVVLKTIKFALANPDVVFTTMPVVTRLMVLIALVCLVVAVVVAILRRVSNGPRSGFLAALGWIALVASLGGVAYEARMASIAIRMTHATQLAVITPAIMEGAEALLVGLAAWLVAGLGNAGAKRAWTKPGVRTPGFS